MLGKTVSRNQPKRGPNQKKKEEPFHICRVGKSEREEKMGFSAAAENTG